MRNLLTALAILFFGFLLAFVIGTAKPEPERVSEKQSLVEVSVISAQSSQEPIQITTHGKVEAAIDIELKSEVSGRISWVSEKFIQGGNFKKNETILEIDSTQYEADVAEAKSLITSAEELLKTEKARANQAKKEWRDLGSKEANDLFLRKPQLASAQAQLDSAKANLKRAEYALSRTKVSTPFACHITKTSANLGQFVTMGNTLARVYAKNDLQVSLPVSQKQLAILGVKWPVTSESIPEIELTGSIGSNKIQWRGEVVSNSANFDENNQLLHILVKLDTSKNKALPGQYVEATITGNKRNNAFTVPEDAFHDKRYILTVGKDNKLAFNPAKFLTRTKSGVLITADIEEGEKIIIDHMPLATEGMQVKIKEQ